MPEADRQYTMGDNVNLENGRRHQKNGSGAIKARRKSLQDPITDQRLIKIEKTLKEMQLKLDEVNKD